MTPSCTAELVARASYGRLLAILAGGTRDIAAAEDALADAFLAALSRWPSDGVPDNPDAWILTTARRRLLDGHRRDGVRARDTDAVSQRLIELAEQGAAGTGAVPDHRLRLLFVCTHPAIDPAAQVPLMLQVVLGLDAARIASSLRTAPKTMGQRLWRAKQKIRDAAIPFEVPSPGELAPRLEAVFEAIYGAFGLAWDDVHGTDARLRDLSEEAIFLGRLLVERLPDEPEAAGLLALMLFAEARREARRDAHGAYIPLVEQDVGRWSVPMIEEAERLLRRAFARGRVGPFQLEAALQSAHVAGGRTGRIDHQAIADLYDGLVALAPSLGALVGRAAALIEARGGASALVALDAIDPALAHDYQPYWAVRADAHRARGDVEHARTAYARAIGLTEDDATRRFLQTRAAALVR